MNNGGRAPQLPNDRTDAHAIDVTVVTINGDIYMLRGCNHRHHHASKLTTPSILALPTSSGSPRLPGGARAVDRLTNYWSKGTLLKISLQTKSYGVRLEVNHGNFNIPCEGSFSLTVGSKESYLDHADDAATIRSKASRAFHNEG